MLPAQKGTVTKNKVHDEMTLGNKLRVFMVVSAGLLLTGMLAVSYISADHEKEIINGLTVKCFTDGREICLGLWQDEESEAYYLFLPSCFAGKSCEFTLCYEDRLGVFEINGTPYRDGEKWTDSGGEEIYEIGLRRPLGGYYMNKTLQVLASENLPAIMITAEDVKDLFRIDEFEDKKYIETGSMVMLDEKGKIICQEKLKRLKLRGNLTATLDKKPLTFSFRNPVGLCGMAPAVKWNLLANATDGSYIRNKVVLDLANKSTDAYEPDGEFVEVYLNGNYQGMYLLTEAVAAAENRVAIPPGEGWFFEIELDFRKEEDVFYVTTDRGQIFAVQTIICREDGANGGLDIQTRAEVTEKEAEQAAWLLNDIESALFAEDGVSELSGKALPELIDLDSWATAWLIQEISGDHDTGIASQFSYTINKEETLLYAGPVWDFDGTMGNVNTVMFRNPAALTTSIEQTRPEGNANQNRWLSAMYRNEDFRAALEEKYQSVFREYLEEMLSAGIDRYKERIDRSAALDALRWHEKRLGWQFVLPEGLSIPEDGDYSRFAVLDTQINMVKEFLSKKKEFLDKLWVEGKDFCIIEVRNDAPFLNQDYNQTIYYWIERGQPMEGLPCYETEEYQFLGYKNQKGERVADGSIITEDAILVGEWMKAQN